MPHSLWPPVRPLLILGAIRVVRIQDLTVGFIHFTVFIIFSLVFSVAGASNNDDIYNCEVRYVGELQSNGTVRQVDASQGNDLVRHYLGTKFTIRRSSGDIQGPIVSNQTTSAIDRRVLDTGTPGRSSYKALTIFGPNTSILYIQVRDFGGRNSEGTFPFIGFRWEEYISGVCW